MKAYKGNLLIISYLYYIIILYYSVGLLLESVGKVLEKCWSLLENDPFCWIKNVNAICKQTLTNSEKVLRSNKKTFSNNLLQQNFSKPLQSYLCKMLLYKHIRFINKKLLECWSTFCKISRKMKK